MPGLYIHIPYCVQKCAYCDFVSVPAKAGVPAAYVSALRNEAERAAEAWQSTVFDTVFFGGGTPTLLSPEQVRAVGAALTALFSFADKTEFTVECNPGTVSAEKLAAWREIGANRLSVGLQSACDPLLCTIGRIHRRDDFTEAVRLAKEAGFTDISADLMVGLPGQRQEDHLASIRFAAEHGVTHISAYSLILEEGTPLARRVATGECTLPDPDSVADAEDAGRDLLGELGFERYEISNYAKPGHRCRHNITYWENGEWLGLGAAAHSAKGIGGGRVRSGNPDDIEAYISAWNAGHAPQTTEERLTPEDEMFECVMLGLRMTEGFSLGAFERRFGMPLAAAYPGQLRQLKSFGWLDEAAWNAGRCALTERGLDFESAAAELFL
ncbi:MAG: radical SAM family heme chaperone HemW [Clostridia bacterium]|nr:radical SAM family heme chaperone HemW [Clostridia bacterium]